MFEKFCECFIKHLNRHIDHIKEYFEECIHEILLATETKKFNLENYDFMITTLQYYDVINAICKNFSACKPSNIPSELEKKIIHLIKTLDEMQKDYKEIQNFITKIEKIILFKKYVYLK